MVKQLWLHEMYDSQSIRNSTLYEELDEKWSDDVFVTSENSNSSKTKLVIKILKLYFQIRNQPVHFHE